ncbi:hypothetical protein TRFO_29075 [Tritrichomonas foetus]|uniref:Polycystin cation channel PKD1/PKD2 domain-containing protein n=1 Tax=Tritrichomonas foetus TaxID=1144522 RepID=A0A1J4JXW2_9EUKA|nr:hypothetical protein TRFO_29075 [Tritrichomonas foetus]|eukprot:OHT03522.1 hypothetical protein TRFO_29075 [Tritrichomonas foetus]
MSNLSSMSRTPFLNYAALIPMNDHDQPSKLLVVHNRNEEVFVPKDDNLQAWKREYIIPWGPLFDLFIVLLYIFFALTYQSSKINFYLHYNTIFDTFFLPDEEEESTTIYFRNDLIESANSTAYSFFDFVNYFPSQDNFSENSNLRVSIETLDDEISNFITRENITLVFPLFEKYADNISYAALEMDYLITRVETDIILFTKMTYTVTYSQVRDLGILEISSEFVGENSAENGSILFSSQLSVAVFPIALVIVDSIAIILTLTRFISYFKHAKEYANKNYITLYRALLWKMDRFEIFNISYQVLTLISVSLFIKYVNADFGRYQMLLLLLSFASLLHCIGLFTHLRLKKETWFVARLIFKSISRTLLFVFGFIPFYIAWSFMGLSFFGYFSELFDSFLRSLKVMFSMMHTDICMDTQDQLNEHAAAPNWLIVTFVCSWLCLTGGMVINILIAIVENTLEDLIIEGD